MFVFFTEESLSNLMVEIDKNKSPQRSSQNVIKPQPLPLPPHLPQPLPHVNI